MVYEIAGLTLAVEGSGAYTGSRMVEYALPLQSEGERSCNLELILEKTRSLAVPKGRKLYSTIIWTLVKAPEGDVVYQPLRGFEDMAAAVIRFSPRRSVVTLLTDDETRDDVREFIFAGHAFSQMALNHGRLVLHSACVAVNGRAVLFSAPSGTGKSTHAGLWLKHVPGTVCINDDTPVLRLDRPEAVYACGSPWSGKTEINANVSAPLAAIVFLDRGTENRITPLSVTEALPRLLGEIRKLPFQSAVEQAAELCGQLLRRVPVYKLSCDISYQAVETVRKELSL